MTQTQQIALASISFEVVEKKSCTCPACQSQGLSIFYSVDEIPINSCMLFSSRKEALNCPKGSLRLGFCKNCGFITNTVFDSQLEKYSAKYEDTQGFSSVFNNFAKMLTQKLITKYSIRNKTVFEIGCGKGEFLYLICRSGNNKGIGIDPAYIPGRLPDLKHINLEFIRDFYSQDYSHIKADMICCRHTLEHIQETAQFLKTIRHNIDNRMDALVFFELPDTMRVLNEGAFWDLYYEHCSYFTAGSLAGLFRRIGFEIDDLYLAYNGQYLILTAYSAVGTGKRISDIEQDLQILKKGVEQFAQTCLAKITYWTNTIAQITEKAEKVVLWGSGSKATAFLNTLKLKDEIKYVVDINPHKQGSYVSGTGQKIIPPQLLKEIKPNKIIITNPVYYDEIQRDITSMNLKADLLTL